MASPEQRFEADKQSAYRALQDARQYVTDFDRTGSKAKALYERLARASRMMRPWSTDGTQTQSKKAIEYLNEITSIISEKIGPASRREFREQGGTHHVSRSKSPTQLDREIAQSLARTRPMTSHLGKPRKKKEPKPDYDVSTAAGQKRLMLESVGMYHPDVTLPLSKPGEDWGADPIGDGTFRMVPSGDIVSFEEMRRRRPAPKLRSHLSRPRQLPKTR